MRIDNSDIKQKYRLRQKVYDYHETISELTVFEGFAGEGNMTNFWHKAKTIYCVDLDKNKLDNIYYNNIIKLNENVNGVLKFTSACEIIDLDSYGIVFPLIINIVFNYKSKKPRVIFFTDGDAVRHKKLHTEYHILDIIESINPIDFYIEKSIASNVIYGMIYV